MKKFDKRVFTYFIIMICSVILLLCFAYFSGEKIDTLEKNYDDMVSVQAKVAHDGQIKISELENEIEKLKAENENLKNQNENLTKSLEDKLSAADPETYQQSMKILADIYLLIENEEFDKAKTELERFDTTRADDTILNFKKALENLLK